MPGAKRYSAGLRPSSVPGVSLFTCRYQYVQPASSVISTMFPDVPLASVRRNVTVPSVVAIERHQLRAHDVVALVRSRATVATRAEVVGVRDLADHGERDPAVGPAVGRLLGTGGCGERVQAGGERDDNEDASDTGGACVTGIGVSRRPLTGTEPVAGLSGRPVSDRSATRGMLGYSSVTYGSRSVSTRILAMADFSLELNEDQLQLQKWVHDFAADVVRPAGPEWDEREETPWPIIEEAAKIGLYSWTSSPTRSATRPGITFPMISEELCWGDAGIALAIFGTTLGVSGIVGSGTPEQIGEWVPQCFGTPDDDPDGRVRGERTRRRQRRVVAAHARGLRRSEGRVGAERHQDVDHERRHHAGADRARRRRRGRARAEEPRTRVVRRPARHARPLDGPEVQEDGHPRQPHRRGRARRRARSRQLPARRQGEARRAARTRT